MDFPVPTYHALACHYEAGRAVVAVALRGPEAVEWTAVLPSERLERRKDANPRRPYGVTKFAIPPIERPELHPLQALDDAVIALAGARAKCASSLSYRFRPSPEDAHVLSRIADVFCGPSDDERSAFRHWIATRADFELGRLWDAVASVAASLGTRYDLAGVEVAAEVAASCFVTEGARRPRRPWRADGTPV